MDMNFQKLFGYKAYKANRVFKEKQDYKDLQVSKDYRENKASRVFKEYKEK